MAATVSEALRARFTLDTRPFRLSLRRAVSDARLSGRHLKRAFGVATKAALLLTAVTAGIGVVAVKMAATFSDAMAEVSTLLDVSAGGVVKLTGLVKRLSIQFGVEVVEQARALYQVISAGATKAADSVRILTQANILAAAGVTSVAVAAEAISRVLNAYSLAADQATRVSDILFTVVKKGVTTLGELAPQIGRVAGLAASLGISFEELAASIIVATKVLPIEEVITGVNALMVSFVVQTDRAKAAAKALGIQFDASAVSAKGLGGVMAEVVDALGGSIEELQRVTKAGGDTAAVFGQIATKAGVSVEVITALFPNLRALKVALALASGEGKEFEQALRDTAAAAGATRRAFDIVAATMGFLARMTKTELAVAFIELGNVLTPVARDIVGAFRNVVKATREWITANDEMLRQNVAAAMEAIVRSIGMVGGKLISVVEFFRTHPLAGQFGLVGLVFLGPAGAATFIAIGAAIDALANKMGGPQTIADALRAKLEGVLDEQAKLLRQARDLEREAGRVSPALAKILGDKEGEVRAEAKRLGAVIAGIKNTIAGLAAEDFFPFDSAGMDQLIEKFRKLMAGFEDFRFDPLAGAAGVGRGIAPAVEQVKELTMGMLDLTLPTAIVGAELQGIRDRLAESIERTRGLSMATLEWQEAMEGLGAMIQDQVVRGFADVLLSLRQAGDTVKWLGQLIFREIVTALIQAKIAGQELSTVFASVGPLGIALAGFGFISQFFQSGGIVRPEPGRSSSAGVAAMVHPGEVVLSRSAVQALGGAMAANRLNTGIMRAEPARAVGTAMVRPSEVTFSKSAITALSGAMAATRLDVGAAPSGGRMELIITAESIPEPTDFGIIASKPQVQRLIAATLRTLAGNGFRF